MLIIFDNLQIQVYTIYTTHYSQDCPKILDGEFSYIRFV